MADDMTFKAIEDDLSRSPARAKLSAAAFGVSLLLALAIRAIGHYLPTLGQVLGFVLCGFGAIVPPFLFMWEWYRCKLTDRAKIEDFKYSQELAKNIWLAGLAVVAVVAGIHWAG